MKYRLWICALSLLLIACSSAQTKPAAEASQKQPGTQLESFMGKRGRLLLKDSYDLGQLSNLGVMKMDALVIYEPNSTQKIKGLRVEVTEGGRFERSSTSFIDVDELESLSQALAYMADLASKWNGQSHDPYTEVTYTSKGEFEVGFYQKGTQTSAYCKSGMIGGATAFLKIPDLQRMKALVDQARTMLASK